MLAKLFALIATLSLALAVTACGGSQPAAETPVDVPAEPAVETPADATPAEVTPDAVAPAEETEATPAE